MQTVNLIAMEPYNACWWLRAAGEHSVLAAMHARAWQAHRTACISSI
jgi:hypothetical protein